MDKNEFSKIFGLARKFPWLVERQDSLEKILFNDCRDESQRDLIFKLINQFFYIDEKQFQHEISLLAMEIISSPKISINSAENVIISAMAHDSSPDSSQAVIQFIKVHFQKLGYSGFAYSNSVGDLYKIQKREDFKRNKVIIIDDFLGSGKTALSKLNFFKGLKYPDGFDLDLSFAFMFGSAVGVEYLASNQINFEVVNILKRGISDQSDGSLVTNDLELMADLEANLSDTYGSHSLNECSMGYGKTEALFAIENASIPNSVFPIFWWGKYRNDSVRNTLFTRYVGE